MAVIQPTFPEFPEDDPGDAPNRVPIDARASAAGRDEGMATVEDGASLGFMEAARLALTYLAWTRPTFFVDDVWQQMGEGWPDTRDYRAMGPVMSRGKRDGLIDPTDEFVPSAQVRSHSTPRRVWKSRVFRP